MYLGLILGRQSPASSLEQVKKETEEKVREELRLKQRDTAVTMHSEMVKIRNSIVDSAQAYQEIVKTIDKEIAPWQEVAALVDDTVTGALPLVIAMAETEDDSESQLEESDIEEDSKISENES